MIIYYNNIHIMDYFERMAILVAQNDLKIKQKQDLRKEKLELQIKDYTKCYCGYVYNNFEHYYKKGLCKGTVLKSRINDHKRGGRHLSYINYAKNFNGVIRQLNCIVKFLFDYETLLIAVIKNKTYHKLNKR